MILILSKKSIELELDELKNLSSIVENDIFEATEPNDMWNMMKTLSEIEYWWGKKWRVWLGIFVEKNKLTDI